MKRENQNHAPSVVSKLRREPGEQISRDAPPRGAHVVVGGERRAAEGAGEVEVLEPGVEAVLVEHVSAVQPAHVVPTGQPVQADHAVGVGDRIVGPVRVGADPIQGQLFAEDDEGGQAGADDVVEGGDQVEVVQLGAAEGRQQREEADVVQDSEDEGVEITYAFPDDHRHEYEDRFRRDVGELVLQSHFS